MADPKLTVEIGAVITDLERKLAKATKDLQKFSDKSKQIGKKLTSVGKNLTIGLTLPLAIFGGVAVKSFAKFESELAKIEGLVGIAGDEVAAMGKKAKSMASDFGKSGVEAAEALFFITSAGLRGKEAMDVLESAMKASVAGLGETKVVADLATSAMNAYRSVGLSAAEATDILTKSVREGKLESTSLGAAMGKVLPIASSMGVTFNEVGAAFASMSRTGTQAAEASTQLKSILGTLLRIKPGTGAAIALKDMGLSAEFLRQNIKDKGLLDTLEILSEKFKGNDEAAAAVFGNISALTGIMDLMGDNVEGTREIFASLNDTMGATDAAFKVVADTAAFRFSVAVKGVTNELDTFGGVITDMLLPKLEKLAGFLKRTLESFENLSPSMQKTIVKIGLVVAALGPLLVALGVLFTTVIPGLVKVFVGLKIAVLASAGAFQKLTIAMLANPIGVIVIAIGLLILAFTQIVQKITPAVSKLKTFLNLVKSMGDPVRFATLQLEDQAKAMEEDRIAARDLNRALAEVKWNEKVAAENAAELTAQLLAQAAAAEKAAKEAAELAAIQERLASGKKLPTKQTAIGTTITGFRPLEETTKKEDTISDAGFGKRLTDAQIAAGELLLIFKEFDEQANALIVGSIAETFGQLGEAIGTALAEGGNVFDAIGQSILMGIGNFLKDFGKLMIQYGVAALAFSTATKALSNPITAGPAAIALIAAGTALTIIGAAISSFSKGSGSGSFAGDTGGSGGGFSSSQGSANASTGISSGRVVFEIAGSSLVGVLSNELRRNKALGGQNLIS